MVVEFLPALVIYYHLSELTNISCELFGIFARDDIGRCLAQ